MTELNGVYHHPKINKINKITQENDIQILKSLYFGNHLNKEELKRCKNIIKGLEMSLNNRCKNGY